jgi:acetyl esterase/lipase
MRIEDYPPQEPMSKPAASYHDEVMRRGQNPGVCSESRYGENAYQSLAIFPAAKPDGRVLVFIHGGGWTNGYKEWMSFMAPAFTAAGVTFVSLGYRLAPEHVFPTGYDDLADALVNVLERVASHGGDPKRLFIGGHSAGGHYAALLATRADWWQERGLPANPIKGCLPVSGVYRFGEGSGMAVRPRFLGPEADGTERRASPIEDIAETPPFLMAHGDRDFPHLMVQAEEMEKRLAALGAPVRRIVLKDADHFIASYLAGDAEEVWVKAALQFMDAGQL